jgi:DNA-binding transcriptional LysR family regulator
VFLTFAERMESEMLNGREATSSRDLAVSGTVRVGAPDGFGVAYLAPRLVTLSELYPELSIELVPVPRSFSLSRREADIAVTLERPRQGRLVARKLTDYTLGLYAARSYLERYGTPGAAEELAGHRLVGYVEDLIFSDALNYTDLFLSGWRSKIAVSSAMGQTVAVRSGAGIGILHGFMARAEAGLVPVLPDLTIKREYWLVVHEDVRALRRIKIVADFLSDLVKGDAAIFV